ncbi:hypothetical protein CIT25_26890 [Mesorhizobium mediterraneum]|uniref:Uncharacterized protein n=1 Tax=Mesorhizobium mediterraneum TaxID=43617 RepID=A0AB36R483_9HYPH|nr:hypothetical protein CIT25_26890 [Mesorhizobium mediterraneum]
MIRIGLSNQMIRHFNRLPQIRQPAVNFPGWMEISSIDCKYGITYRSATFRSSSLVSLLHHVFSFPGAKRVAVQRIIGGVEIKHDLPWHLVMGTKEQVDKTALQRLLVVSDPVI